MAKNCLFVSSGIICTAPKTSSLSIHRRRSPADLYRGKGLPETTSFNRILSSSSSESLPAMRAKMIARAVCYSLYLLSQIFTLTYLSNRFSKFKDLAISWIVGRSPGAMNAINCHFWFRAIPYTNKIHCSFAEQGKDNSP